VPTIRRYRSGAGFFRATSSALATALNQPSALGPSTAPTSASTFAVVLVAASASFTPASRASVMRRTTPGRAAARPSPISS
jgi:hypothetical protein